MVVKRPLKGAHSQNKTFTGDSTDLSLKHDSATNELLDFPAKE